MMLRRVWSGIVALVTGGILVAFGFWLVTDPETPLPAHWNPITPLEITAPLTPWTQAKLRRTVRDDAACLAVLSGHAEVEPLPPLVGEGGCGIDPRLRLSAVGGTSLAPLETTCAIALRLAMWDHHVVQPAAERHLGTRIAELRHQSSYNCRPIRTPQGDGTRLSTHGTAEAIDVAGVVTTNGAMIPLLGNWGEGDLAHAFYRDLRDGGCTWFRTVLGPEFNSLHADHFHMQSIGRGTCR